VGGVGGRRTRINITIFYSLFTIDNPLTILDV
jgi:hypothetical protein